MRILSITNQDEDVRDEDQDIKDKPGATVRFGLGFAANFACLNSLRNALEYLGVSENRGS